MTDSITVLARAVPARNGVAAIVPGQAGPPAAEFRSPESQDPASGTLEYWSPESALGLTCRPCRAESIARGFLTAHPHRAPDHDRERLSFAEWTAEAGEPPW